MRPSSTWKRRRPRPRFAKFSSGRSARARAMPTEQAFSQPIALVLALGLASILPFAFMTLTAFVKISTVLQIVRGAIGAQNIPSNTLIMAFAGALTLLAMAPLGTRLGDRLTPLLAGSARADTAEWLLEASAAAKEPVVRFLSENAGERERSRFYEIARAARPAAEREQVTRQDLTVVAPAF